MASQCKYCAALSISGLIDVAGKEFGSEYEVPETALYHHRLLDDLELSADNGCGFCTLILDCFKDTPVNEDFKTWVWRREWIGPACKLEDSMFSLAKKLPLTDIKIYIDASHVAAWQDVRVFDTVFIVVGRSRHIRLITTYSLFLKFVRTSTSRLGYELS
ncbi:hypothetical protein F4818DRAFT_424982 [Hypoxylon cercidicola]|nr:hypothetical protein F4818DRAFT_424982 [Hypoxylon cercidicola]